MLLLPASEEFVSEFPSPRHLSLSGSYPLDLSGLGDPTGSNATADIALRITETHKALPQQGGDTTLNLESVARYDRLYDVGHCHAADTHHKTKHDVFFKLLA
jgi:hypothetical protein